MLENEKSNLTDFQNKIINKEVKIKDLERRLEEENENYNRTLTNLQNIKEQNEQSYNISLKELNNSLISSRKLI